MGEIFNIFLIILLIIGVVTKETFVFILIYLLAAVYLLSHLWVRYTIQRVEIQKKYQDHIFCGEKIDVDIYIKNKTILPIAWFSIQELLSTGIYASHKINNIINLRPLQEVQLKYSITGYKRGYFQVGPTRGLMGDLLGLVKDQKVEGSTEWLTVYPRIFLLPRLVLPPQSPQGSIKYNQPLFEDPTRPIGKRQYVPGDSIRRIDWKTSASSGKLQVRTYEPSIAMEIALFLNLNHKEYNHRIMTQATELAVIIAASIANWGISKRQSVGFFSNGNDPFEEDMPYTFLLPQKGRKHLMQILEELARIQVAGSETMLQLVNANRGRIGWGGTQVWITAEASAPLLHEAIQAKRAGHRPMIIVCDPTVNHSASKEKAKHINIPFFVINNEIELDIWQ